VLVNYFIQATRVFVSGIVNICVSACGVAWLGATSSNTRAPRSGCSLHEIRFCKTQVSVTQSTSDWALRAKSQPNLDQIRFKRSDVCIIFLYMFF
jgi:hypothetical protein